MKNLLATKQYRILNINKEGSDSKLFTFSRDFDFRPGQFMMVSLPGYGEAPISICSGLSLSRKVQLCVRKAGKVTTAMHQLKKGDKVGLRGPYGNHFPIKLLKDRNILLIAGGLGLEPLRPVIEDIYEGLIPVNKVQVFYGACDKADLLFTSDYKRWGDKILFYLTMEKASKEYLSHVPSKSCEVGLVTKYFKKFKVVEKPIVFLVGPPVMYRFVFDELKKLRIPDHDIYISYERRMHCGLGVCQHCSIGSKYVCREGPVFKYKDIKNEPF